MDALDLLERRIDKLLEELSNVKTENALLKARIAEFELSCNGNAALEDELREERSTKEKVLARIDALLTRLTEAQTGE